MDIYNMSDSSLNNSTEAIRTAGWILNVIVTLPENIYVIWLIVTGTGNGVASEIFSLNLSICEILFCLQCFFSLLNSTFPSTFVLVVAFMYGVPITGRTLFQSLICVVRYLAVVHPVTFLKYKPLRYRLIWASVGWIIIIANCVLNTLDFITVYVFMCYCLCQVMLSLSVQLFCLVAVLRALKKSGPGDRKRKEENHMKRKAFNTILLIMMSVLFIYFAYVVATLVYVLTKEFVAEIWTAGQFCFMMGGLVQPLLYLHRTGKLPFCKAS